MVAFDTESDYDGLHVDSSPLYSGTSVVLYCSLRSLAFFGNSWVS